MDKKPKKELIAGIKDFLKDFEEPYDHKEWKNFKRQRKGKQSKPTSSLFVKLAGIAASLFLMVYAAVKILPLLDDHDQTNGNAAKQATKPLSELEQQLNDTLSINDIAPSHGDIQNGDIQKGMGLIIPLPDLKQPVEHAMPTTIARVGSQKAMYESTALEQPSKKTILQTSPLAKGRELYQESVHGKRNKSKRMGIPDLTPLAGDRAFLREIKAGINVNPTLTERGFSVGGGVSAQIPLSKRIYTEIGINYLRLTVGEDIAIETPDMEGNYLIGTRNKVGMVTIPISLNYSINNTFSASLGLVPFRAVSDQRTDIIQSYSWTTGGISGDTTRRLVAERNEMTRRDSLYRNNNYLGFVQLSGHISPPLLNKHNTVIAPYIGVPIGRLRHDPYRWLHGGVSLRIYLR